MGSSVDKGLEERPSNLNLFFVCQLKPEVLLNRSNLLLCTYTMVSSMHKTRHWLWLEDFTVVLTTLVVFKI